LNEGETVVDPVQFSHSLTSAGLQDVPPTVIDMVACTIEGNPKPKTRPHYISYKMGVYDDSYRKSHINDIAWMVARFFNGPSVCERGPETPPTEYDEPTESTAVRKNGIQPVPVWSAYNSLTHTPLPADVPTVVDQAFGLQIINAAAHEWTTLITALDQLSRVNDLVTGPDSKLVATMDMYLYKRRAR